MTFEKLIPPAVLPLLEPNCRRLAEWMRHFDLHFYRHHRHWNGVADLEALSDEELRIHFVTTGWKERRGYSAFLHAFIDPTFYRARYPELGLHDDLDAVAHWMYEGYFEGRIPNSVTRDVLESEIHLFQFGKVASKSIEKALYAAGHARLILHVHFPSGLLSSYPDCILPYEKVVNTPADKPLSFITGVRNPFERMISGYFQSNLSGHAGDPEASPEEACEAILRSACDERQVDHVLNWFDHGFFRGVDVYRHPFATRRGYDIIKEHNLRIFLYRYEDLAAIERPLSEFTDLAVRLERVNTSAEKPYGALHRAVIETLSFPPKFVEEVLGTRLVRHFYSAEERDLMRKRWSRAASSPFAKRPVST